MSDLEKIFSYLEDYTREVSPNLERSTIRHMRKVALFFSITWPVSACLWPRNRTKPVDYLFIGTRLLHLAQELKPHKTLRFWLAGLKDIKNVKCAGFDWDPTWRWVALLSRAYSDGVGERQKLLERVVAEIERSLSQTRPRAVVLHNDISPLYRAISIAARRLNIPVLTVQDGLWQFSAPRHLLFGEMSDYLLVWGEAFRRMYEEGTTLPGERVHVLGYPFRRDDLKIGICRESSTPLVLCILGQPFSTYDDTMGALVTKFAIGVVQAAGSLGLKVIYRPHPKEDRARLTKSLPGVILTSQRETLSDAFRLYDLFVSPTSTALIEASLHGKMALQVRIPGIFSDDYQKLGACYSLNYDLKEIEHFLAQYRDGLVAPFCMNPDYVEMPENLGQKFCELAEHLGG